MKRILFLLLILGAVSCSNPYLAPNTSKALSEQAQLEEVRKQTAVLEAICSQMDRIAHALEQLKSKPHGNP